MLIMVVTAVHQAVPKVGGEPLMASLSVAQGLRANLGQHRGSLSSLQVEARAVHVVQESTSLLLLLKRSLAVGVSHAVESLLVRAGLVDPRSKERGGRYYCTKVVYVYGWYV